MQRTIENHCNCNQENKKVTVVTSKPTLKTDSNLQSVSKTLCSTSRYIASNNEKKTQQPQPMNQMEQAKQSKASDASENRSTTDELVVLQRPKKSFERGRVAPCGV